MWSQSTKDRGFAQPDTSQGLLTTGKFTQLSSDIPEIGNNDKESLHDYGKMKGEVKNEMEAHCSQRGEKH